MDIFERTAIDEDDVAQWMRPPVNPQGIDCSLDLDIETVDVKSTYVPPWLVENVKCLDVEGNDQVPCLSVYGVTTEGHSVCANVWNFSPYFYIRSPKIVKNPEILERAADEIRIAIDRILDTERRYPRSQWRNEQEQEECDAKPDREERFTDTEDVPGKRRLSEDVYVTPNSRRPFRRNDPGPCVIRVEPTVHKSAIDSLARDWTFFRVSLRTPKMIRTVRDHVMAGMTIVSLGALDCVTYESSVVFENRFMIDCNIVGAGWTRIKGRRYTMRDQDEYSSSCQLEIDLDWHDIVGLDMSDEANKEIYERPSMVRVISYDIECQAPKGKFPDAASDPAIQISVVGWRAGDQEAKEECKLLFTVGGCSPIQGTRVISSETEAEMLNNFGTFQHYHDPDIIIGYNTKGFDDTYLYDRATILGSERYLVSGRSKTALLYKKEDNRQSRNNGNRQGFNIEVVGRVGFDMLPFAKENLKLRSYRLNAVAAEELDDQKEDLHYSMISVLQEGSDDDRRKLGIYCLKDAVLPKRLATKMMAIQQLIEFGRISGVQLRQIQDQGPSIRVMISTMRAMKLHIYLMPYEPNQPKRDYEGASVFKPIPKFYTRPVAVLDFESLYPSIMIAHNICFSTHVPETMLHHFNPNDLEVCPKGHHYVKREKRLGILTEVLEKILARRSLSKKFMAEAAEAGMTEKAIVYNLRQLALKVFANSVYGWTALSTSVYFWYCADSTTAYGREQIKLTKRLIEEKYCRKNGYPFDAKVIYGDTDSVMVYLDIPIEGDELDRPPEGSDEKPVPSDATKAAIALAIEYAKEMAVYCTEHFVKPNRLAFENIYWPYLLLEQKKRYAGPFWENAAGPKYTKIRGLETVRRDNCLAATRVQAKAIDYILYWLDPDRAYAYACSELKTLCNNEMDLGDLVISQNLNKRQHNVTNDEKIAIRAEQEDSVRKKYNLWPQQRLDTVQKLELRKACNKVISDMCEERGVYVTYLPHAEVDRKLSDQTGMGYSIGDRVPYIVTNRGHGKKALVYQKATDPVECLEKQLLPDIEYYAEQIAKCAAKVLAPVFEKHETYQSITNLLDEEADTGIDFVRSDKAHKTITRKKFGDATLARLLGSSTIVRKPLDITFEKSISRFFVKLKTCIGCHTTMDDTVPRLCIGCRHDAEAIYARELRLHTTLKTNHDALKKTCHDCTNGDKQFEDACRAVTCPSFFRRTTVARKFKLQDDILKALMW